MIKCFICSRESEYFCSCSKISMCKIHLWTHLSKSQGHDISKGYREISKKDLQSIEKKIKLLINKKSEILNQTFKIQDQIKKLCSQSLNKLDFIITKLKKIVRKGTFAKIDKNFFNRIKIDECRLDSNSMTSIQTYYSDDFLKSYEELNKSLIKRSYLNNVVGNIRCITLANDEKFVISGGLDAVLRVWDIETMKNTICLFKHKSEIYSVASSSKSDLIASGGYDKLIVLWKFKENKVIKVLKFHDYSVVFLKIDQNESKAFSSDNLGNVNVWSLKSYEMIFHLSRTDPNSLSYYSFLHSKFFKIESKKISVLYHSSKFEKSYSSTSQINCFHLFNNELYALAGLNDGSVVLLDPNTCSQIQVFKQSNSECKYLNSSKNDKYFISAHINKFLFIYSVENCETVRSLEMVTDFNRIEIFNNLTSAIFPDFLGILKIDLNSFIIKESLSQALFYKSPRFSSDNKFIAYASQDCAFSIWSVKKKMIVKKLYLPSGVIAQCLSISRCNKFLLTGSSDYILRLWDIESSKTIIEFKGHTSNIRYVSLAENVQIAISLSNIELFVWDMENRKLIKTFKDDYSNVESLALSDCGRLIAYSIIIKEIIIKDLDENTTKSIQSCIIALFDIIQFSRNAEKIICLTKIKEVYVFDIQTSQLLKRFKFLNGFIRFSLKTDEFKGIFKEIII